MNVRPILSLSISFLFEMQTKNHPPIRKTFNIECKNIAVIAVQYKNKSHWAAMKMLERSAVCF